MNIITDYQQNTRENDRFRMLTSITEDSLGRPPSTQSPLFPMPVVPHLRIKYLPEELITYYLLETFEKIIDEKGAENLLFQMKQNQELDREENNRYNLNN